jgi:hypothetical protein
VERVYKDKPASLLGVIVSDEEKHLMTLTPERRLTDLLVFPDLDRFFDLGFVFNLRQIL